MEQNKEQQKSIEEVLAEVVSKSPLGNELCLALMPEDQKVFEMLMKRGAERWATIETKQLRQENKRLKEKICNGRNNLILGNTEAAFKSLGK